MVEVKHFGPYEPTPELMARILRELDVLGEAIAAIGEGVANSFDGVNTDLRQIREQIADLYAAVDELQNLPDEDDSVVPLRSWAQAAGPQDWADLAEWVDWLMTHYDIPRGQRIAPCWPAHPGVVEELAALRSSWRVVAKHAAPGVKPSVEMINWHDRWMAPCLERLQQLYTMKNCLNSHQSPPGWSGTDREALRVAAGGP